MRIGVISRKSITGGHKKTGLYYRTGFFILSMLKFNTGRKTTYLAVH